jgi:drug/metabolite transporter (DMT)-like permease
LSQYLGEIAALGTSLCFSVGSTMFTLAGRKVGSMVLNRARLVLAVLLLGLTHWLTQGEVLPLSAEPERWFWLGASGFVGLVLGDIFLFQAFIWIGPRLSMLMMSLAPVLAALLAWLFLGESLTFHQIFGILVTLGGVLWVVIERNGSRNREDRNYGLGILYGLGGATGQALGLVLAKNGLGGDFSPISGNLIRMLTAAVVLWCITLIQKQVEATIQTVIKNRQGALFILGGAVAGPFLGVSLSLLSIQYAPVGIASTLMALPPVFLLPVGYFVFKERFGWGAILGTFVAITGVAFLFLV